MVRGEVFGNCLMCFFGLRIAYLFVEESFAHGFRLGCWERRTGDVAVGHDCEVLKSTGWLLVVCLGR